MKIDASPTKDFFISILGRDITLLDAVKDLVDNSVDGARGMRPDGQYQGLSVKLFLDADRFRIEDNCGGISVEVARDYAFRFGKAAGAPSIDGSIGQFGVGMKRALFKLGELFEIRSVAPNSRFTLRVDVGEWKTLIGEDDKELWEFEFAEAIEGQENASEDCGTIIEVTKLHPSVSAELASNGFKNRLTSGIQEAHERGLESGLEIEVNDYLLHHHTATLLAGSGITPIVIQQVFAANPDEGVPADVRMKLCAGISSSSPNESGWYIICNGRQVVKADKTPLTGWATILDEIQTPRAHNQFSRFRGFVQFESDNASGLPWNTSKSGIDIESPVYQWARGEMISALRQVLDFLNSLDTELQSESTALRDAVGATTPTPLSALSLSRVFRHSTPPVAPTRPRTMSIQFDRLVEDVEFAKRYFNTQSGRRAVESGFDYFLERERE